MPRDSTKTRAGILQAADALFYAEGIRSVSMDRVAEQAGVTKRTLYYHFRSKDDLVAAYLNARHEPTFAGLMKALESADGKLALGLARLFDGLAAWGATPQARGCPFARAAGELAGQPDHPALAAAAHHKATVERWLEAQCAAAGTAAPELLARQLMVLIDGAITEMMVHRDPGYARAAGAAARTLVDRALSARPELERSDD